jgi:hypothetical protein
MITHTTFYLFIPLHLIQAYGMRDDSPPSPLRSPITLVEFDRLRQFPPSPASTFVSMV